MPNLPLEGHDRKVTASPEHLALARKAGCEGMVLLKNNEGLLPLKKDGKVALFGKGVFDYVKGGGGSGDVTVSHVWNLYDGFVKNDAVDMVFEPLARFYKDEVERQYRDGAIPGMTVEPQLPEVLVREAREFADTAVIVISRFSGEGWDRRSVSYEGQDPYEASQSEMSRRVFEQSDYCLTDREQEMVRAVCEKFEKVVAVLNVGGMVDTTWFAKEDKIS